MASNPGRPIWILSGFLIAFGVFACVGGGIYVAFFAPVTESSTVATPTQPPPAQGVDLTPRLVEAQITQTAGAAPVAVGAACRFNVEGRIRDDGTYWCNAQVTCGGLLLYGGPSAGYFMCELRGPPTRHVIGADAQTSSMDSDSSMEINTETRELRVRDDPTGNFGAYHIVANITRVR